MIFDREKYVALCPQTVGTLQFFITNRCNKRCAACFYNDYLGKRDMSFTEYTDGLSFYLEMSKGHPIKKVILLGGEPTLHPDLVNIIKHNQTKMLDTTVYTNGYDLSKFNQLKFDKLSVRIGVMGLLRSEKPLSEIKQVEFPVGIVYMLRKDNVNELLPSMYHAEKEFNCKYFMISSIRDVETTGSFWEDTDSTVSNEEYKNIVNKTLQLYDGKLDIHISRRGVIDGPTTCDYCRFINIHVDGKITLCPFDISKKIFDSKEDFGRDCNKHNSCILQKIVLKNRSTLV